MSGKNENAADELLKVLRSMEQRLTALEGRKPIEGSSPVIRTTRLPSHSLGANEKTMNGSGFETIESVPVCSVCHRYLTDVSYVCHHCGGILDEQCTIILNSSAHCERCLRKEHLDLTRRDYEALICLSNGITDNDKIAEVAGLQAGQVRRSVLHLATLNLIVTENRMFGLSHEIKITDDGAIAVNVYRRVYGRDEIIVEFGRKLRMYLGGET